MANVVRVANCSGFYGDRLSAAKEMVEGGPIDALTGDYLAELTMAILHKQRSQGRKAGGYVGTFLKQLKQVLKPCVERQIKIVTNAGGLNPAGMAAEVSKISRSLGIKAKVAYIEGDDIVGRIADLRAEGEHLIHLDRQIPLTESTDDLLTANVYLGCWGIKAALDRGADVVVCPRVTDAAVVIGVAAWKFNWSRHDFDALAGALTAGHVIECGGQACGGNYSYFHQVRSFRNVGFPIAEIESDGSFTVTKHPGTGGLVSVGTVTAQLLYETHEPGYKNPDVIAHFDSLTLTQVGDDRVRVSGVKGSNPPATHKVCINMADGFKSGFELMITGLDVEDKAEVFLDALFDALGGRDKYSAVEVQLFRSDKRGEEWQNEEAVATLRVTVRSPNAKNCGNHFQQKVTEMALCSIPGFLGRGPMPSGPVIKYWPALIDSKHITEVVYCPDGEVINVQPTQQLDVPVVHYLPSSPIVSDCGPVPAGPTREIALGRLFATRSGDKGGCANVGVWANSEEAATFLFQYLTVEQLKKLLPDTRPYKVERYQLGNLKALNFFIHDILGDGVSSNSRLDAQAKTLGEYLRSKIIRVPVALLGSAGAVPVSLAEGNANREWRGALSRL